MAQGILTNEKVKEYYENLNFNLHQCNQCRTARIKYEQHDKKKTGHYCSVGMGFSSERLSIPIDVLILSESHGGGDKAGFREQKTLQKEINEFNYYYREYDIVKFNQYLIRQLVSTLDKMNKTWLFTDLLKCFVAKEEDNMTLAIQYCSIYLMEQLSLLRPKVIICLGNKAFTFLKQYFDLKEVPKKKHGSIYDITFNSNGISFDSKIITSLFPSQWNADRWVANDGWNPIIEKV